jgi:hypothetical protein
MAVAVDQEELMLLVGHSTVKAAVMAQFVLFGPEPLANFHQLVLRNLRSKNEFVY